MNTPITPLAPHAGNWTPIRKRRGALMAPRLSRDLNCGQPYWLNYWLNNRRVAAEPAGMPACSSFA